MANLYPQPPVRYFDAGLSTQPNLVPDPGLETGPITVSAYVNNIADPYPGPKSVEGRAIEKPSSIVWDGARNVFIKS